MLRYIDNRWLNNKIISDTYRILRIDEYNQIDIEPGYQQKQLLAHVACVCT